MGLSVSSLFSSLSSLLSWSKDKDVRILMLGLDSAGKVCRICMPRKNVFSNGHRHRVDDNFVQATGNHTSLLCVIRYNASTPKIGEVVSTIPSEQITSVIIRICRADQIL